MKLINQSYEILGTPQSLEEAWSFVAKAARNCYQSEKVKMDESEEDFCRRLLLKHPDDHECDHMSPFEFGIVYLHFTKDCYEQPRPIHSRLYGRWEKYYGNRYSRHYNPDWNNFYITTNLRVIIENGWEDDLKYAGAPTEHHVKACAFKLITNRAVMAEITRHRTLSFCIESTRYCNYNKDKFGNELTFIEPCWFNKENNKYFKKNTTLPVCLPDSDCGQCLPEFYFKTGTSDVMKGMENWTSEDHLMFSILSTEWNYLHMIELGWTPQQAATILPNTLKTTIMMCGYEDNLQHMFRLRAEECSGPVHPQMAELMKPLYEDYKIWKLD